MKKAALIILILTTFNYLYCNQTIKDMTNIKDISGRYGRLLAVAFNSRIGNYTYWDCVCDCGIKKVISASSLRSGHSTSCGCLHRERFNRIKHGHGTKNRTPTYSTWQSMISRCTLENSPSYKYYGGRGITVCDRWRYYQNFLDDMGERPLTLTLERKDNNLGYNLNNCVWASREDQSNNKRNNLRVNFLGKSYTIAQLSRAYNIPHCTLRVKYRNGKLSTNEEICNALKLVL